MKKIIFWTRLSNISAIIAIAVGVILRFFESNITNFIPFMIIAILSILLYLTSEVFKFLIKKKLKK